MPQWRIYSNILHLSSADSRFAEEESELLDKETRLLKHRLNRSKYVYVSLTIRLLKLIFYPRVAARDLAQTIKTLRSEVEATEKEVCSENAKLSELCVDVCVCCHWPA